MKICDLIKELSERDPEAEVKVPVHCVDWGKEKIEIIYAEPSLVVHQDGCVIIEAF